jgi:hypothetical protein
MRAFAHWTLGSAPRIGEERSIECGSSQPCSLNRASRRERSALAKDASSGVAPMATTLAAQPNPRYRLPTSGNSPVSGHADAWDHSNASRRSFDRAGFRSWCAAMPQWPGGGRVSGGHRSFEDLRFAWLLGGPGGYLRLKVEPQIAEDKALEHTRLDTCDVKTVSRVLIVVSKPRL